MQKISALPATEQLVLIVNLLYRTVMTVSDLIRTLSLFQVLRLSLRAGTIPHYSLPLSYWLWFLDTVYVSMKPCNFCCHLHLYRGLHMPKNPRWSWQDILFSFTVAIWERHQASTTIPVSLSISATFSDSWRDLHPLSLFANWPCCKAVAQI